MEPKAFAAEIGAEALLAGAVQAFANQREPLTHESPGVVAAVLPERTAATRWVCAHDARMRCAIASQIDVSAVPIPASPANVEQAGSRTKPRALSDTGVGKSDAMHATVALHRCAAVHSVATVLAEIPARFVGAFRRDADIVDVAFQMRVWVALAGAARLALVVAGTFVPNGYAARSVGIAAEAPRRIAVSRVSTARLPLVIAAAGSLIKDDGPQPRAAEGEHDHPDCQSSRHQTGHLPPTAYSP